MPPLSHKINRSKIIRPWDAFIAPTERVSLEDAIGRKAASTIRQYPPGIPDITPGMTYSEDTLDTLTRAHAAGADIIGVDMLSDRAVNVVIERQIGSNKNTIKNYDIDTFDSRSIKDPIACEIADYFRTGFSTTPYYHFAFHESDPLQSLPHTIDYAAYAVSVGLSDAAKQKACQDTLREIAIQRAKEEKTPDLEAVKLPKGFHRWTDKEICRVQIKDRLSDPGYVTLVREKETAALVGLLHSRMGTVERLFHSEEWSDPLLFSTYTDDNLRDNPEVFFEKIAYHFGLKRTDVVMTISAQIISPKIQGGEVFYEMMRSMARRVSPEHSKLPVLSEIPPFGTAHMVNSAMNERLVYGVLKNEHPVVFCQQFALGLFPLIADKKHWQYILRKAASNKRNFQKNYFIPLPTDNQSVSVKPNGKLGLAVFATANIPSGSRIAVFTGETYRSDTAMGLPSIMRDHAIQINSDEYVFGHKGLAHCLCHSCYPNCGIRGLTEIFTTRDILKGEQVTWDYRCSENSNWKLEHCLCAAARCTGSVGNHNSLPQEIKAEYISKGMVSDWLTAS